MIASPNNAAGGNDDIQTKAIQFNLEQEGYKTALLSKYRVVRGQAIRELTAQHTRSNLPAVELNVLNRRSHACGGS